MSRDNEPTPNEDCRHVRRQTKIVVMYVAALTLLAIVIAWIGTPASVPPGYLVGCVIVAVLFVADFPWANRHRTVPVGGILGGAVLVLMRHYFPTSPFSSIVWWQAMVVWLGVLVVVLLFRATVKLVRDGRRGSASR